MSLQVEKMEKNMAKLTVTVSADNFEEAMKKSFNKNKNRFTVPGFRKGKATRQMVEKHYGIGVLLEDAVDISINETYPDAAKESELDIVAMPQIDIVKVGKGEEFVYTATVALKPEVTLGEYKGLEIAKKDAEVTEKDIEDAIKVEQNKNARLVSIEDRAVISGDTTVIDFEGSIDGKLFDGGAGEDYTLVIGSNSFIAGFEDQIIGHNVGDEFDINVTFPENYHIADLAAKPAVFKVKLKEIKAKDLPEINDDFISEISEFETLEEYKKDLKVKLGEAKEKRVKTEVENEALSKAVENASMDIPEPMVKEQVDRMINDYANRMSAQGYSLDQYMQFTGMTVDTLRTQMEPGALNQIKSRLVLEKIAEVEKLEASDEDIENELKKIAQNYKMELDKVKEFFPESQKEALSKDIILNKAVDLLVENVKMV